ncbi:hypothetical protein PENTCL1PPCAC_25371, partial [Pristionchus entomophagus]
TDLFEIQDGDNARINMKILRHTIYTSVHPAIKTLLQRKAKPHAIWKRKLRRSLSRAHDSEGNRFDPLPDSNQTFSLLRTLYLPPLSSSLIINIDPSCRYMDCMWALRKIDYDISQKINIETNSTDEDVERLACIHCCNCRVVDLKNGSIEPLFLPSGNAKEPPHTVLYYHRYRAPHWHPEIASAPS